MIRVKICGIRSEVDLDAVVQSGAHAAGFLVGQLYPSKDFILPGTAARLVRLIPPYVQSFLVTQLTDADEIADLVAQTGITNIQLENHDVTCDTVSSLRDLLPASSKIIVSGNISGERDFPNMYEFFRMVNGILLDVRESHSLAVETSLLPLKWSVFARFRAKCPVPVFLSGGLSMENLQEAVRAVQPFGVDVCASMRNSEEVLSVDSCRTFVNAASAL